MSAVMRRVFNGPAGPGVVIEQRGNGSAPAEAEAARRPSSPGEDGLAGTRTPLDSGSGRAAAGKVPDGVDARVVSLLKPASFAAEQYRGLRHVVERLRKTAGTSVLAVSSPAVHDGKTVTAINLAGALAQPSQARILLVEADLRRPSLGEYLVLGEPGGPGLTGLIADPGLALEDAVRTLVPFNLDVLPAGDIPPTPYDALESPRLGELLEEARRRYDFIVLDTPPLVPVLDCRVIGRWVDGFLVVVAAHKTPRKLVEEALTVMEPSKVLGIVFNGDDRTASGYVNPHDRPDRSPRAGWWRRLLRRHGARGRA